MLAGVGRQVPTGGQDEDDISQVQLRNYHGRTAIHDPDMRLESMHRAFVYPQDTQYVHKTAPKQDTSYAFSCPQPTKAVHLTANHRLSSYSYSPLSLSCFTLHAISKKSASSFKCELFSPVATLALGLRPAYITCLRS